MPRGSVPGERRGGRKKGTPNKRTIERQANTLERQTKMIASGATPLEVMMDDMRFHHAAAIKELSRGQDADLTMVATSLSAARTAAKDAAPYLHHRLTAIEHTGKDRGPIAFTDAREQLAHLITLHAAARGVGESSPTTH